MCGRFAMSQETDDLISQFVAAGGKAQDWRPSYSVTPSETVPIVRERVDEVGLIERELQPAVWGLKPTWWQKGRPAPINARLESVASKPYFRNAFASQRALVPMTGYFEWVAQDDGKQPYFIQAGGELLAAAGLYELRKNENDEWGITYTVITRQAKDASGQVHDRMPVFLPPDLWEGWLSPDKLDTRATDGMLHAIGNASDSVADTLDTYPVARAVNNVRTLRRTDLETPHTLGEYV